MDHYTQGDDSDVELSQAFLRKPKYLETVLTIAYFCKCTTLNRSSELPAVQSAMATPDGSGTLPPASPSTSQTSTDNSQTESSAARCCVFQQKQKRLRDEQLFRAQSQPENTSASNTANFQDSGENPISVSTSAANTGRQAVSTSAANTGRQAVSTSAASTGRQAVSTSAASTGRQAVSTSAANTGRQAVSTSAANTGRHAVSATWVNGRYSASYGRYLKRKNKMKSHFRELKRQRQTEQFFCRLDDVRRQLLMLTELHKRKCQNMN